MVVYICILLRHFTMQHDRTVIDLTNDDGHDELRKQTFLHIRNRKRRKYLKNCEDLESIEICDSPVKSTPELNLNSKSLHREGAGLCAICLEELMYFSPTLGRQVMSTTCGHLFCQTCIVALLQRQALCPTCRHPQTLGTIHPIYPP